MTTSGGATGRARPRRPREQPAQSATPPTGDPSEPGCSRAIRWDAARGLDRGGLENLPCGRCGEQNITHRLGGRAAGGQHDGVGGGLHIAGGGCSGAPGRASIDDGPVMSRTNGRSHPHLCGWESVRGRSGSAGSADFGTSGDFAGRPRFDSSSAPSALPRESWIIHRAPASGRDRRVGNRRVAVEPNRVPQPRHGGGTGAKPGADEKPY